MNERSDERGKGKTGMKSSEYAKVRSVLQQDVEMTSITTTRGVNWLTPEPARLIWRGVRELRERELLERAPGCGRNRVVKRARVVVGLATDRRAALGTDVVVLVAAREHEEQFLTRRRRAAAARTEEARRLELLEAVGSGHQRRILADRTSAVCARAGCGRPDRSHGS